MGLYEFVGWPMRAMDEPGPEVPREKRELFERMWAALHGSDVAGLRSALGLGANWSWKSKLNGTPVVYAAWHSSAETVAALLEAGADPTASDRSGWTALHGAARASDPGTVALLLGAGADPNAAQASGHPPLLYAFVGDQGGRGFECAKLLLAAGADPEGRDERGRSPLHEMMRRGCFESCSMLIRAGARLDARMFEKAGSFQTGMSVAEYALRDIPGVASPDEEVEACLARSRALADSLELGAATGGGPRSAKPKAL